MMDLYKKILLNKIELEKQQNRNFSLFSYNFKSCLMTFKVFLTKKKLDKCVSKSDNLFLNWGSLVHLYDYLPIKGDIVSFDYRDSSYSKLMAQLTFCEKLNSFKYFFSKNPFAMVFFDLEYRMLEKLILSYKSRSIFINGIYDRYSFFIEKICKVNSLKFNILQHGALTDFNFSMYHECNQFWLLYDHSKTIVSKKNLVNEFKYLKKKSKLLNDDSFINFASYGTTPGKKRENELIIKLLLNIYQKLIVYPHPRDNNDYNHISGIMIITKERYITNQVFVCGMSTLGLEFLENNCNVLFFNPENKKTDFSNFHEQHIFNNINELYTKCLDLKNSSIS